MISLLEFFGHSLKEIALDPVRQVMDALRVTHDASQHRPPPGEKVTTFPTSYLQLSGDDRASLRRLVDRFGADEVGKLVRFGYDWKYGDWEKMRGMKQTVLPRKDLCDAAFSHVDLSHPTLFRGLSVAETSPWAREGYVGDLKLPKRSIASWTTKGRVAADFSFFSARRDGTTRVTVQLVDPGDAYVLSVSTEPGNKDCPNWYRMLYYALTAAELDQDEEELEKVHQAGSVFVPSKGGGEHEGEGEVIISVSRCQIKTVLADDSDDRGHMLRSMKYGRHDRGTLALQKAQDTRGISARNMYRQQVYRGKDYGKRTKVT